MGDAMGDEGNTSGKRRNGRSIFLGIVGAVLGFVGMLALIELTAPRGPTDIATALFALVVLCPIGAVAGAFLGAWLGNRGREQALMDEAIRDARAGGTQAAAVK
jgi:hypothetical protein